MAVLVVEDVLDVQDIVSLIDYLTRVLASGNADSLCREGTVTLTQSPGVPSASYLEELVDPYGDDECYDIDHRGGCSCQQDAAATDPRQALVLDSARSSGPVQFVACPCRGEHAQLTDCWMCWSDVMRGAIPADHALAVPLREGGR